MSGNQAMLCCGLLLAGCGDLLADESLSVDVRIEVVSPATAPLRGNVELTLVGDNLDRLDALLIDGTAAPGLRAHNSSRATCFAPPMAVGAKSLSIRTRDGRLLPVAAHLEYYVEQVRFAEPGELFAAEHHWRLLLGDVDGDGDTDIVLAIGDSGITAYLNQERGRRFTAREIIPARGEEWAHPPLALGDLDGDGSAELITPQGVLPASGGGQYRAPLSLSATVAAHITRALIADFSGDGVAEAALLGCLDPECRGPYALTVARLGADGVLRPRLRGLRLDGHPMLGEARFEPVIAAGDMDGDGAEDLVFLDARTRLQVLLGPSFERGAGAGSSAFTLSTALELRDVDADGHLDIVYGGSVVRGSGDAALLGAASAVGSLCGPSSFALAMVPGGERSAPSLSRCGLEDSVHANRWVDGRPQALASYEGVGGAAALGDLDGDGVSELVYLSDRGVRARWGSAYHPGELQAVAGLPVAPDLMARGTECASAACAELQRPVRLAQGRFPGAHRLAAAWGRHLGYVAPGGAALEGVQPLALDTGARVLELAACDLDADGEDDLVVAFGDSAGLGRPITLAPVHAGAAGLRLGEALAAGERGGGAPEQLLAADFDGDGRCDLGWVGGRLWLNTAAGMVEGPAPPAAWRARAGDVNGDGAAELYGLHWPDGQVERGRRQPVLWWNDGHGGFAPPVPLDIEPGALRRSEGQLSDLRIVVGADGAPRLWAAGVEGARSASLRAHLVLAALAADGSLGERVETSALGDARELELVFGELDGDGALDLLAVPARDSSPEAGHRALMMLARSIESGEPQSIELPAPATPTPYHAFSGFEAVDLDGDGLSDLAFGSQLQLGKLVLLRNDGQ